MNYGITTTTQVLDYLLTIPISTGIVYELFADSGDGLQARTLTSQIVPDNDPSHPIHVSQPYYGQFIQMDIMYATFM